MCCKEMFRAIREGFFSVDDVGSTNFCVFCGCRLKPVDEGMTKDFSEELTARSFDRQEITHIISALECSDMPSIKSVRLPEKQVWEGRDCVAAMREGISFNNCLDLVREMLKAQGIEVKD